VNMANEPKDAHEVFKQFTPRLVEIAQAVEALPVRERLRCAHMLVGYFMAVASAQRRGDLRLVPDTPRDLAS
jgi:hypothetical protein